MRGCAVIFNRLIDSAIWLKCKDEGRRRKTGLMRGIFICPTWKRCRAFKKRWWSFEKTHRTLSKTHRAFSKTYPAFSKTYPAFSKTHRAFSKTSRSFCSTLCGMPVLFNVHVHIVQHIRWHKPARTYAWAYTYIRIDLRGRTHKTTHSTLFYRMNKSKTDTTR